MFSPKLKLLVFVLMVLALGGASAHADIAVSLGDPAKQVLRGRIVTPDEIIDGKLVVQNDTITCVGPACDEPENATVYDITDAYVFPGFIDAHNHVAYNALPKWTPTKRYQNRGQWQREASYKAFKKPYDQMKARKLLCEMVKYGEIKALISGVTTIQGSPPAQKCFGVLIRNAESENGLDVPAAHVRTFILDIKSAGQVDWSKTKSFVVHLSEGVDEKSRKEFDTLRQKGLLTGGTAIIHGTAFTEKEFGDMAQAGAKLIWSPQSNLALYGQTTRVDLALKHGVGVSLGVDWNPTGSDNLFDELRVAEQVNREKFDNAIPDSGWIGMVTVNPAAALALDGYIGSLAVGKKADIAVVRAKDGEPNWSLLKSHLPDVELVEVGGRVLYGDESVVAKVRPGRCEPLLVQGSRKQVCVNDPESRVVKSGQSLGEIMQRLQAVYPQLAGVAH